MTSTQKSQQIVHNDKYYSTDGKPLDFSFKNISNIADISTLEPRQGQRKQILCQDQSSEQQNQNEENANKNGQNDSEKQDSTIIKRVDSTKDNKDQDKNNKKQNMEIIRISPNSNIKNVIQQNNAQQEQNPLKHQKAVPFQNNIVQQKKVIKVNLVCTQLILGYNQIRSLQKFYIHIDSVMFNCTNLGYIDISHNYLETLNYDFKDFPNLKTLLLHCNFLRDMKDILQLENCNLRNLTIHGNPLEDIPNFRLYIQGILQSLVKLDTVLISRKEKDNARVWMKDFKNSLKLPVSKTQSFPPSLQNSTKQEDDLFE